MASPYKQYKALSLLALALLQPPFQVLSNYFADSIVVSPDWLLWLIISVLVPGSEVHHREAGDPGR